MLSTCLNCQKNLQGRKDKKFCSEYCKSDYHHKRSKNKTDSFFHKVNKQLKQNRKILKQYNKSGKSVVLKEKLIAFGFNPNYFTHYWKNNKGEVYLFCFEYGYLRIKERQQDKYILVEWQEYMFNAVNKI